MPLAQTNCISGLILLAIMKGVFWKGVFFCNPAGIHISESIERMIAEGLSYSEISRK